MAALQRVVRVFECVGQASPLVRGLTFLFQEFPVQAKRPLDRRRGDAVAVSQRLTLQILKFQPFLRRKRAFDILSEKRG